MAQSKKTAVAAKRPNPSQTLKGMKNQTTPASPVAPFIIVRNALREPEEAGAPFKKGKRG
jgi:hypothetical protein